MESSSVLKQKAWETMRAHESEFRALALRILQHPEVGYAEEKASAWLSEMLAQHGFQVERPLGGLPTAFLASRAAGEGPTVAFLAEYDALPGVGHGCGHNLIGTAAAAAGIGVAAVLGQTGGRVSVMGTPAEEITDREAGKIALLQAGAFEGMDVTLMMHPWYDTRLLKRDLGFIACEMTFTGHPAHAAVDPWNGANALDGVILTYNNINALRQHVQPDVRIHGIISEGGQAPNIIPERAVARFMVRSQDSETLERVYAQVEDCARAGALATGTAVEIRKTTTVLNTRRNATLDRLILENFTELGEPIDNDPLYIGGSTDFGNVSQVIPSAMFWINTHPQPKSWHSAEVAQASGEEMALRGMMLSAEAMAGAAVDLLDDPIQLEQARRDFQGKP